MRSTSTDSGSTSASATRGSPSVTDGRGKRAGPPYPRFQSLERLTVRYASTLTPARLLVHTSVAGLSSQPNMFLLSLLGYLAASLAVPVAHGNHFAAFKGYVTRQMEPRSRVHDPDNFRTFDHLAVGLLDGIAYCVDRGITSQHDHDVIPFRTFTELAALSPCP